MPRIDVVSLVGSAVPAELRSDGLMACWLLMVDGQPKAGPFASRDAALACQAVWMLSNIARPEGDSLLAWHRFTPRSLQRPLGPPLAGIFLFGRYNGEHFSRGAAWPGGTFSAAWWITTVTSV